MNGNSDSDEVKSNRGINTRLPLCTPVAISASISRFRNALITKRVPDISSVSIGSFNLECIVFPPYNRKAATPLLAIPRAI